MRSAGSSEGVAPREIRHRGTVIAGGHALEDTELGIRIGRRWPEMSWLYQPHATVHHAVDGGAGDPRLPDAAQLRGGRRQGGLAQTIGSQEGLKLRAPSSSPSSMPRGVMRGLRDLLRGDGWGFARAAAIAVGVVATGSGYAIGALRVRVATAIPSRA